MSWKHAPDKFFCSIFFAAGFLVCAILLLSPSFTQAIDHYWNVSSGDWSDTSPYPWSISPEPTSSDNVYINNGGTVNVTQSGEVCDCLYLGKNSSDTGTIILSGTGQLSTYAEFIGYSGTGTFYQSGGQLSTSLEFIGCSGTGTFYQSGGTNTIGISAELCLGDNTGSSGTYNLSGTGQLSPIGGEYIGNLGTGIFNQYAGTHTIVRDLTLGNSSGGSGTYNLNGGTLIVNNLQKGSGTAAFNFGGGTLRATSSFTTSVPITLTGINGDATIDTQSYNVSISSAVAGNGGLNKLGSGTLTLSGNNTFIGPVNLNGGTLALLGTNTFTGPVNLNSGLIKAASLSNLGNGSALNFNGGGLQFNGVYDPSVRTMTFQGGGAILDTQANNITLANPIGNGGPGGLTKKGSGILALTAANTFTGAVNFNGGLIKAAALNNLGNCTTWNFNGGGLQFDGVYDPSSVRAMTFQSGAILDTQDNNITLAWSIGKGGNGGLSKFGSGTLTLSNVNFFTGAVNFNGGLIKAAALYNLGNGTALNFNGGGLQFDGMYDPSVRVMTFQAGGATFDTQTNDFVFANSIGNNGSGGLTKNGTGMLELRGAISYNGDTIINDGQLRIDNNLCTFLNAVSGVGDLVVEGTSTVLIVSSFNGNALNIEPGAKVILASPTDTMNVSTIVPDITTAALATFEVANGTHVVGAISGGGITQVDIGASLTAQSISQNTLIIGSGAILTISPVPGGPLSGTMLPVPEPSVFVLLAGALVLFIRRLRR